MHSARLAVKSPFYRARAGPAMATCCKPRLEPPFPPQSDGRRCSPASGNEGGEREVPFPPGERFGRTAAPGVPERLQGARGRGGPGPGEPAGKGRGRGAGPGRPDGAPGLTPGSGAPPRRRVGGAGQAGAGPAASEERRGARPPGRCNGGASAPSRPVPAPLLTLTRVTLASRRSCCTTFFMAATLEEPDMVGAAAGTAGGGTPSHNFPALPKLYRRLRSRRRGRGRRRGGRCGAAGGRRGRLWAWRQPRRPGL